MREEDGAACLQLGDGRHLGQDELAHCTADVGQVAKQHVDAAL